MANELDLFGFLGVLSKRDLRAYEKLSPEAKKQAAPFVLMRWMTGTSDPAQIVRINTFVNPYIFSLGAEKGLLLSLLAAAATGNTARYYWQKGPGSKSEKLRLEVIRSFYDMSTREAADLNIDSGDIMAMAEELGWDDDQLKKLKAEVAKDEPGNATKPSKSPKKR
jgi:hypothetical protein